MIICVICGFFCAFATKKGEYEEELDMGGTFDWFGPESHPDFCGNPETGEYTGDNSKSPAGRSITHSSLPTV